MSGGVLAELLHDDRASCGPAVRALSLWQPWAAYVVLGGKRVENRSWHPRDDWRGVIAVHAGLSWAAWPEAGAVEPGSIGRAALAAAPKSARTAALTHGAVVALAVLADCHRGDRCSVWAERGAWHWTLSEVTPIEPVRCRGQRGLWTPDADLLAALRSRVPAP